MKKVTNEEIIRMAENDADAAYIESGCTQAPDGGWDAWLINGIGGDAVCRKFGEPVSENQDGWSPVMAGKMETYHKAACELMARYDAIEHEEEVLTQD